MKVLAAPEAAGGAGGVGAERGGRGAEADRAVLGDRVDEEVARDHRALAIGDRQRVAVGRLDADRDLTRGVLVGAEVRDDDADGIAREGDLLGVADDLHVTADEARVAPVELSERRAPAHHPVQAGVADVQHETHRGGLGGGGAVGGARAGDGESGDERKDDDLHVIGLERWRNVRKTVFQRPSIMTQNSLFVKGKAIFTGNTAKISSLPRQALQEIDNPLFHLS